MPRHLFIPTCVFLLLIATSLACGGSTTSTRPSSSSNQVTLVAAPGNTIVQLFAELRDGFDVKVYTVADRTRCARISGPHSYGSGTTAMNFLYVDCNGIRGYVNTRWVR